MATPLRPGNVVEVINILSLPLCPEGLFECLKRHRSVVIDSSKPAVIEHNPDSNWGSARVLSVGNANVQREGRSWGKGRKMGISELRGSW
jgi:hypothetical protein